MFHHVLFQPDAPDPPEPRLCEDCFFHQTEQCPFVDEGVSASDDACPDFLSYFEAHQSSINRNPI